MNVATIAGLLRASSAAGLQDFLQRQHGVQAAEANPVSQTVTVRYDDAALTPDDVRALIEGFGCTCGGEIVPCHLCRGVLAGPSLVAWLADRAPFPKRDLEATS